MLTGLLDSLLWKLPVYVLFPVLLLVIYSKHGHRTIKNGAQG